MLVETRELQPKINSLLYTLTKSEKKVAKFVLHSMDQVIHMSITDLAEQAIVGETTVLRFCRKVGFKGYQEFKLAVAKATVHPLANLHGDIAEGDELQFMIQKITSTNVQALQDTFGLTDTSQLEKAIDMILTHNKIYFYGVGVSGITAADAKSKFLRIGLTVDAISDSHLQAMSAATLSENDVAVGLSVSGSTRDIVEALHIAKENGAKIITITHFTRSPITKISDLVLLTAGKETPLQGGSLAAKIAQLHVIDMLFTGVALRMREKALFYKEKTAKAVVDKAF
jgi:DNA-binding MurR/RpiR family transcriptional regulator